MYQRRTLVCVALARCTFRTLSIVTTRKSLPCEQACRIVSTQLIRQISPLQPGNRSGPSPHFEVRTLQTHMLEDYVLVNNRKFTSSLVRRCGDAARKPLCSSARFERRRSASGKTVTRADEARSVPSLRSGAAGHKELLKRLHTAVAFRSWWNSI